MVKRRKLKSQLTPVQQLALFAPPQLLEGEDQALYDELLARLYAEVQPDGVIEEVLVVDFVYSQWELLRWRRLKFQLLTAAFLRKLQEFLSGALTYFDYRKDFQRFLENSLQKKLPEEEASRLARRCALEDSEEDDKIDALLEGAPLDRDGLLEQACTFRAEQISIAYARREIEAVELATEFLNQHGKTIHDLTASAVSEELAKIERFESRITTAETSRNASLREIDRHRVALGQVVRRTVQDIEDGDFRVIESKLLGGRSE